MPSNRERRMHGHCVTNSGTAVLHGISEMRVKAVHPESNVPRFFSERERELTPYSWIAQAGCRGVTGPVPQPLFMKFRPAPRSKLEYSSFSTVQYGPQVAYSANKSTRKCI